MLFPSFFDFFSMFFNHLCKFFELSIRKSAIISESDYGFYPKLCFAFRRRNMYMHPRFFTRKKEEPITLISKICSGYHNYTTSLNTLSQLSCGVDTDESIRKSCLIDLFSNER